MEGTNTITNENEVTLYLSLSLMPPPPPPPPSPEIPQRITVVGLGRLRRNPTRTPPPGKPATIPPPFPWSGSLRANVRSLDYLRSQGISQINGEVQCKRCNETYEMDLNLEEKFKEVYNFVSQNDENMNARAPESWRKPALLNCRLCNERNSIMPVISDKKRSINWLFLFLVQMLGFCTLKQLKYFCKHTKVHRTGAKDRLVFNTYKELYKQLQEP